MLAICVFAAPGEAQAGQGAQAPAAVDEPDVPEKVGKELRAHRIDGALPRLDGRIDDEVWSRAPFIDDLVQNEPDNMQPPTERTVVQIAFDDRDLYLAVQCFTKDPSQIVAALGRRDSLPPSDILRISFDPRHDHRTAYVFHVNAAGVQSDDTWYDDTRQSSDYDAVWDVVTSITSEGWFAELRIPFSQMRFPSPEGQAMVWGFNIRRDLQRRGEYDRWVATPRGVQGFVSRFGHLTFPEPPAPPRRLELVPYASLRREMLPGAGPDHGLAGGLDARVGLGTSGTLSATVNPDFGQVEQDPAVLNLTVFETFFPEKRPFFIEDSRMFVPPFNQMQLFHSRRIGQRPSRYGVHAGDAITSRPDQTTILGAAKVTGKASRWTYGGITALTAAEYAVVAPEGSERSPLFAVERLIEPATMYGVGRVQRDLLDGSSTVGALGTAVLRDHDSDAFTGGLDYSLRWGGNRNLWEGHWVGTHAPVNGRQASGFGGISRFTWDGKYFNTTAHVDHFSRSFRNTDLGFLATRVNKTQAQWSMGAGQPDPRGLFRSYWFFAQLQQQWNGDDLVFDRRALTGMDLSFTNFWYFGWNINQGLRALDDLDTRGGPPIVKPAATSLNLYVNTDSRKTWRVNGGINLDRDEEGGWNVRVGPTLNLQPWPRLQASLSTSYSTGDVVAQWITNRDVNDDGVVDHVYGRLDRQILDLTGRATFAFERNLTLQIYVQPFVAVGDYTDIRRLARPSSFDFLPATLPYDPDFNTKSLRGNTVLRWEYKPGSTLFVVWNLSATDGSNPGVFRPWQDLGTAFAADGTHVFMVKATYWLGL